MIKLKKKEILNFTFELSILINQNYLIQDALSIISKSKLSKNLRKMVVNLSKRIKEGSSFNNALKEESKSFSNYYISSIKSGEESGNIGKFLENIYTFLEKQEKFERKMKNASFYPFFVLILAVFVVIALTSYIVPMIVDLVKMLDISLPSATLRIITFSNFLKEYWIILLISLILLICICKFFVSRYKFFFDSLLLRIPYFGEIVRKKEYFKFFSEFALLVKNGIRIEEAIQISEEALTNLRLRDEVELARCKLLEGSDLSDSLSSFIASDSYLFSLLKIGEESNRVSENLTFANSVLEREVEERRERILKSIEPVMLVIVGMIILIAVYNLYLPILSMLNGLDFTSF